MTCTQLFRKPVRKIEKKNIPISLTRSLRVASFSITLFLNIQAKSDQDFEIPSKTEIPPSKTADKILSGADSSSSSTNPQFSKVSDAGSVKFGSSGSGSESGKNNDAASTAANNSLKTADGPTGADDIVTSCEKLQSKTLQTYKTECKKLTELNESCTDRFYWTGNGCFTEINPSLVGTLGLISGVMGTVKSGISDSCSAFQKIMDLAGKGMAAYSAVCGTLQTRCNNACEDAVTFLKKLKSAKVECPPSPLDSNDTSDLAKESKQCTEEKKMIVEGGAIAKLIDNQLAPEGKTLGAKLKVCEVSVATLLGVAAINAGNIAQSLGVSEQCKKDTAAKEKAKEDAAKDCARPENAAKPECQPKDLAIDCAKSENADKPICICKANPRLAGCEGISTSLAKNSINQGGQGVSASGSGAGVNTLPSGITTNANIPNGFTGASVDGTGGGAGAGSFGAGGSSGLGASNDSGENKGLSKEGNAEKLNANILSGSDSGGGGGFRFGSNNSPQYKAGLRNYAEKLNLRRNIAGEGWNDQVTSNGGKSNFEKVKTRYIENRAKLISY